MADLTNEQLAAQVASLQAALYELLNRTPARTAAAPPMAVPPPPDVPYGRYPEGPRIVQVAPSVHMRLVAPVCSEFEPGFYAGIFGRDPNPGDDHVPYVNEPSNARPDQLPRSASGYPLRYRSDGVFMMNADGLFRTEAEIAAERAERARRNEQSRKEWGNYRPGGA